MVGRVGVWGVVYVWGLYRFVWYRYDMRCRCGVGYRCGVWFMYGWV